MTNQPKIEWIDFGFETVPVNEKQSRVADVFSSVSSSYDIMNDLMSGGVHRLWKDALMDWLAPCKGQVLIDLAGGTGDIALRFLKRGGSRVHVIDINPDMISAGKKRRDIKVYSNQIDWTIASAEDIPLQTGTAERVTISFGLRNVTNRDAALKEMRRVLKPGGRFLCLEFTRPTSRAWEKVYDAWSFNVMPELGALVAKDRESYQYLVESIRRFPDQETFKAEIETAGFRQVSYTNFSGGIAALHVGWR